MLADLYVKPSDYECEDDDFDSGNYGKISIVHPKNKPEEKIALKEMAVDKHDPDVDKLFIREVTNMIIINHPCVLKIIGLTTPSKKDQTYKIYTPFMPNNNLEKILEIDEKSDDKFLTPTKRSIIIYGVASAILCLHLNNIIHRDIKPQNIFLDKDFHPVLSDLGFSRIFSEISMTNNLGTPYYMAPELFGDDDLTLKIDVYAYGVSILQMFSPKLRFPNRQPRDISQFVKMVKEGTRFVIPKDVPEFYVSLITKCWDPSPSKRPSFTEIIQMFEENDDFMLPGSDKEEVKAFIEELNKYVADGQLTPSSTETKSFPF